MPAVHVPVAIEPFMFGQVSTFCLRKERPRAEVTLFAPSGDLAAKLERARPHLVVANLVPPAAKARSFRVEVTSSRGPTSLDMNPG